MKSGLPDDSGKSRVVYLRMKRDLTAEQFHYRATKLGFKPGGFMGYWQLPNSTLSVSVWNAGTRRRDQLRYLLREEKRDIARRAA